MNTDPIPNQRSIAGVKRQLEPVPTAKRLRSRLPCLKRAPLHLKTPIQVPFEFQHPNLDNDHDFVLIDCTADIDVGYITANVSAN